jgi:hypothetical protein
MEDWAVPIFERTKDSVCFVVISPRKEQTDMIKTLASKVGNVDKAELSARCAEFTHSTGFTVGSDDDHLLIMTSARAIDHVYKASLSLSGKQVNSLFKASILCDHYESDYRAAGLSQLDDDTREYAPATIVAVSCRLNLLLITVEQKNIKRQSSDEMCAENHPALRISDSLPHVGGESMLLSWPPHKHRTVGTGCVGERRNVGEVTKPNIIRYDMEILEANITTEQGSSGAPLLNKTGEVIGVLHGGFGETHSFFIPSDLVLGFMLSFAATSGNFEFCFSFHSDTQLSQELLLFHLTDKGGKVEMETKGNSKEPSQEGKGKRLMKEGGGSGKQRKHRSLRLG